jgi:hypothetical protein
MVWIVLLGMLSVLGAGGLVFLPAARPVRGRVGRVFEQTAAADVRARPLSAATRPEPPPDAEGPPPPG